MNIFSMNFKQLSFYLAVPTIIVISFFFYSSNFYPLLSSDDALNILMAHYYRLPHDLYCWGQDRGGTLIPLLSQIFIKIFKLSDITSVSFSNYILLILGYIGFSSIIKSNFYKIIFAIIWFLPFQRFVDIVRYPIGMEYSLIGFSIFLITKFEKTNNLDLYKKHLLIISIIILLILSVWVSDLAIVTIGILLLTILFFKYFKKGNIAIDKTVLVYAFLGFISCFLFVKFAKSLTTVRTDSYLSINHVEQIKSAIIILKNSFLEILIFKTKEIFVSIYAYLVLVLIVVILIFYLKEKIFLDLFLNKWLVFIFFDFIIIFAVFLVSTWVLANGMGRWYFVASYISLALVIILALDHLESIYGLKFFKFSILVIALIGTISTIYGWKYIRPKTLKPMINVVSEFKQLGEIGVIAEFWHSYITSCPDPELIKATPFDLSGAIRKQEIVDMVFERKNLYVIRDMWMKTFPDTLNQFGYLLLKDGTPFTLGDCEVCKYNRIRIKRIISLSDFKCNELQIITDRSIDRKALFVSSTCDTCKEKYLIHGPNIPIGIGDFTAYFHLKTSVKTLKKPIALLEVTADGGPVLLASKKIFKNDFVKGEYDYIGLHFVTAKRYNDIEFKIYYYGDADLFFDQLKLMEN
jgi:hypothetical protein